jgi:hypothetical protein
MGDPQLRLLSPARCIYWNGGARLLAKGSLVRGKVCNFKSCTQSIAVADIVDRMCRAIFGGMLYADVAPRKELCIQLKTIAVRLDGRPDVSTRVIRAWECIYEHLEVHRIDAAAGPTGPVCSTIGCVSTDPAEMVCARCGIYYCSKSCQKSYVPQPATPGTLSENLRPTATGNRISYFVTQNKGPEYRSFGERDCHPDSY